MPAYHKNTKESIEKSIPLPIDQLTLSDLREAVKGRFGMIQQGPLIAMARNPLRFQWGTNA